MKKLILMMVISMLSMTSFSQTLVAHYPLDGNADNYAPGFLGQYDGVVQGQSVLTFVNDSGHYGLQFDGVNDWIQIINSPIIHDTTHFIISMWVKINGSVDPNFTTGEPFLSLGYNFPITLPDNQLIFGVQHVTNIKTDISVRTIPLPGDPESFISSALGPFKKITKDEWMHVVLRHSKVDSCFSSTYSKNNYEFYKNGELTNSSTSNLSSITSTGSCNLIVLNPPIFPLNNSMSIGVENNANLFYTGLMDDVRIYCGTGSDVSDELLIDSLFDNPPLTTGLFEQTQSNHIITIFPNPSIDGVFYLKTTALNGTYTVCDLSGKIVLTGLIENKIHINLSTYSRGFYFLKVEDEKQLSKTIKLIYQ